MDRRRKQISKKHVYIEVDKKRGGAEPPRSTKRSQRRSRGRQREVSTASDDDMAAMAPQRGQHALYTEFNCTNLQTLSQMATEALQPARTNPASLEPKTFSYT